MILELRKLQDLGKEKMANFSAMYDKQMIELSQEFPLFSRYESISPEARSLIWKPVDVERLPLITDAITGFKHWLIRNKLKTNALILRKSKRLLEHLRRQR